MRKGIKTSSCSHQWHEDNGGHYFWRSDVRKNVFPPTITITRFRVFFIFITAVWPVTRRRYRVSNAIQQRHRSWPLRWSWEKKGKEISGHVTCFIVATNENQAWIFIHIFQKWLVCLQISLSRLKHTQSTPLIRTPLNRRTK
jgi:hypothetical protein